MHPQLFLQSGSISTDIKIYTSATLRKQGPLTSTFGPLQDFPYSSVGKYSACKAVDISSIPGEGSSAGEGISYPLQHSLASLVAQLVKNLPLCGMPGLDPWVGKIPWTKERLPTPVFWPA